MFTTENAYNRNCHSAISMRRARIWNGNYYVGWELLGTGLESICRICVWWIWVGSSIWASSVGRGHRCGSRNKGRRNTSCIGCDDWSSEGIVVTGEHLRAGGGYHGWRNQRCRVCNRGNSNQWFWFGWNNSDGHEDNGNLWNQSHVN